MFQIRLASKYETFWMVNKLSANVPKHEEVLELKDLRSLVECLVSIGRDQVLTS
jgi:hypothetical protein